MSIIQHLTKEHNEQPSGTAQETVQSVLQTQNRISLPKQTLAFAKLAEHHRKHQKRANT